MRAAALNPSLALALSAFAGGCAFESTATANRVPVPVLVGPVEQIGGRAHPSNPDDGPSFDAKVDRTVTASSSSQTSGNVTVTTTTTSSLMTGSGLVDAKVRLAAQGQKRLVHIDQLRVNSYSGFFYSAAWISSRVRVKGHIGRKVEMPAPVAAPAPEVPADPLATAPSSTRVANANPF